MTAEKICRQAVANGEVADLTVLAEEQRVLGAAFVRRLVRGVERDESGNAVEPQPSGVRVKGLRLPEDLDLSNIDVAYPVELTDGQFDGRVNLQDAGLRSLSLNRSTFKRPVDARNMETRSDFSAVEATFEDWLSLAGAEIQGDVWLQGAHVRSQTPVDRLAIAGPEYSEGVAIDADGIVAGGSVYIFAVAGGRRFEANGQVRLLGAKIAGQLGCVGGSFKNPGRIALNADNMEVGGGVFLEENFENRFEAIGVVNLLGAKIAGQLSCIGGSFQNPGGIALNASNMEVGGCVFLEENYENRFEAIGVVNLLGAKIAGQLSCIGASFQNTNGKALNADGMQVEGSLLVRSEFGFSPTFDGDVDLVGARVGGYFQWRSVVGEHGVNLSHASVITLDIANVAHPERWQLNGFRYQGLAEPETADGDEILTLLQKCDKGKYFPQPYRQLFRCLRDAGHAEEATNVAVAMRREAFLHEREELLKAKPRFWRMRNWFSEFWEWNLRLIGYGYRPWRAAGIALALWAVGSIVYSVVALSHFHDFMAPAEGDLLVAVQSNPDHDWLDGGPPFISWLYALDRFMPVVDLGQASFFRPRMNTGHTFLWIEVGWWLNAYDWLLIASGWVLSLLFAGSVSGLMRKIDSDA